MTATVEPPLADEPRRPENRVNGASQARGSSASRAPAASACPSCPSRDSSPLTRIRVSGLESRLGQLGQADAAGAREALLPRAVRGAIDPLARRAWLVGDRRLGGGGHRLGHQGLLVSSGSSSTS